MGVVRAPRIGPAGVQSSYWMTRVVEPPIPGETTLFLTNALFLKGGWTVPFDPGETRPQPFHLTDGSTVEVDMMVGGGEVADRITVATRPGGGYVAADLPYSGGAVAMTVVVPGPELGIAGLLGELNERGWDALVEESVPEDRIVVLLPRFTMSFARPRPGG